MELRSSFVSIRLCLNLGCGVDYRQSTPDETWINIDADAAHVKCDMESRVESLPLMRYRGKVDHIEANDILEHVHYSEADKESWILVLRDWLYCLKTGGTIRIQVPDFWAIAIALREEKISMDTANRVIYGENTNSWDKHYQLFTFDRLKQTLLDMGMEILEARRLHVCAIVIARRR